MMTRTSIILFFAGLYSLSAAAFERDGVWVYSVEGEVVVVEYGGGPFEGRVTVPDELGGRPVAGIGAMAFYNGSNITAVTLPRTVGSIGSCAFFGCAALREITLPPNLTTIREGAFHGCAALEQIEIPPGVTAIPYATFEDCSALREINLPASVQEIGKHAFTACTSLRRVHLPEGLRVITSHTFWKCTALEEVNLPSSLVKIWNSAFADTPNLRQLEIPPSVVKFGDNPFRNCPAVEGRIPKIDCDFPGGNVRVLGMDLKRGTVKVAPDMRDSVYDWFWFYFRVKGAAGQTVTFDFPVGSIAVGAVGPAVSTDEGKTWRFLDAASRNARADGFTYAFGPNESSVRFAHGIPYNEAEWKSFIAPHAKHPNVRLGTLCRSRKGNRQVELLTIEPEGGKAGHTLFFTARHHSCEVSASPVVEGIVEELLSDSPEARWARKRARVHVVPFVDKDGCEEGDQGKGRGQWDYNRDYGQWRYPEIRAIRDLMLEAATHSRVVLIDNHSPGVRGEENDTFYSLGPEGTERAACWESFRRHLVKLQNAQTAQPPTLNSQPNSITTWGGTFRRASATTAVRRWGRNRPIAGRRRSYPMSAAPFAWSMAMDFAVASFHARVHAKSDGTSPRRSFAP